MEKRKTHYIICDDVLLKNPRSVYEYRNSVVIITDVAVAELERLSKKGNEQRKQAKEALKELDYILMDMEGFKENPDGYGETGDDHVLFFRTFGSSYEAKLQDAILAAVKASSEKDTVLVTNRLSNKMIGTDSGIRVEGYTCPKGEEYDDNYTGREEFFMPTDVIDGFYESGECDPPSDIWLEENQFVLMRDEMNPSHTALGVHQLGRIYKLRYANTRPYGIQPKNIGQQFALEALLRPVSEAPLVILKGPAGTAKTFLALAAGLQKVVNDEEYVRILVSRPNIKFDEDIGYLKGSEEDKIGPLIRPIFDNLEQLTAMKPGSSREKDGFRMPNNYTSELFSRGMIKAEALAYMRGRSIARTWVIEDEAQNMTPSQAYGIVTRIGDGSKVILCGDPEQCDSPNLSSTSNGLVYVAKKMQGSPYCWQITFNESECLRSNLARDALKRMKPNDKKEVEE